MICYYHANCSDGFTAAWLVWKVWGLKGKYVPCHYGDTVELPVLGETVYVVDFSFPPEMLRRMCDLAETVYVFDHHKTAIENLVGLSESNLHMELDTQLCGSQLVLDHFVRTGQASNFLLGTSGLVAYVQDRDLWQWKLRDSREWSAGLGSYEKEFSIWDNLCGQDDLLIREGRAILRYQNGVVSGLCKQATVVTIGGESVHCVNATGLMSEVGDRLCGMYPSEPFAACYFVRQDRKIQYSLRSRNGFDVSAVARQYGGGGHRAAAGFTVPAIL